ncbi:hypothetical protein NPIL_63781 [Nephila pilipes]|uniref:Uncharacterized protein n=1 Tax=Nephila pilipes TaxID=299642 RepID=A0A8X6KK00_NEPPI|nr:hypothetical protein NPIL_63781 [Nephila pilipes]
MMVVSPVCEYFVSDCWKTDPIQEEEPMDWEEVPTIPEIIPLFSPNCPPRKMRSLFSKVSELPVSAIRFPNMSAKDYSVEERGCFFIPPKLPGEQPLRDQSSRLPRGVPRASLCFELITATDGLRKESKY